MKRTINSMFSFNLHRTGRFADRLILFASAGLLLLSPALVACSQSQSDSAIEPVPPKPTTEKLFAIELGDQDEEGGLSSGSFANESPSEYGIQQLATAFENRAKQSGLDFVYMTGAEGKSLMVETMGGGCGVLDFDADGAWELFLCQGGDPTADPDDSSQPTDKLYRNLGKASFSDVSPAALPISNFAYSQGVAIGDFDNDGFDDIYVTNVDGNQLLRNNGDGSFIEVSRQSNPDDRRWSSSAAFADLNNDGLLDIYVCNYVLYDPRDPIECRNEKGDYRICHPREMEPVADACLINLGDGKFQDQASERGLSGPGSKGLGVAIADFDEDGDLDLYVANDTTANFYFVNQGDGIFKDQALLLGCAMDRTGAYQASMGLGIGDYNRDGLLDIYSSHFFDDSNTLYQNLGQAGFQDVTAQVGLHEPTLERLGFGTVIEDFNLDGRQEIFITNGHIENYPENQLHHMAAQLFAFNGASFSETTLRAGDYFREKYVGRGVSQADFDEDGDLDLVVVHQDHQVGLLTNLTIEKNTEQSGNHFVHFSFQGTTSNRRGIGCKVTVSEAVRGASWSQQLIGGGSYASNRQPRLFFGLGKSVGPLTIEVAWPSGKRQIFENLVADRHYVIHESRGLIQ